MYIEIEEYIRKIKFIYNLLLIYIDDDDDIEENYGNLIKFVDNELSIINNKYEIRSFFYLILKIANNHCRGENFFNKISQIIIKYKCNLQNHFSNYEIFDLFKNNKMILLILIDNKILTIDRQIYDQISTGKFLKAKYLEFFYPEIKCFIENENIEQIPENFDAKRHIGEDDSYICELIRKDSIEEFIIYVSKNNFPIDTILETSIYETNSFLLKKRPSLIEYAAFFGSAQIFRYLYLNGISMTKSLWHYAIHSKSAELFCILEDNKIESEDEFFNDCLKESIKCHHNDVTNYFQRNFSKEENEVFNMNNNFENNIFCYAFHYYNYLYWPDNFDHKFTFYYLCHFGYYNLVLLFLKYRNFDINAKIVFYYFYFLIEFKLIFENGVLNLYILNEVLF